MKLFIILIFLPFVSFSQYNLTSDTTISTTWALGTTIVTVAPGVKIHGSGIITGGYINASYYQNIFDTTLSVQILGGSLGVISTSWFGCSPSNNDNTRYFQKAIDASINRSMILYTPSGVYNVVQLLVSQYYSGNYQSVSLHWKGDYIFNSAIQGTVINCTNTSGYCLGIQKGKGVIIEGLNIQGQFKKIDKPAAVGINYYNIAWTDYKDTTCSDYYSGVVIDPNANTGNVSGGSTGISFKDMQVNGFTVLFRMSPTINTLNGEEIIAEHIVFGMGQTGWLSQQSQEKQNVIRNCMAWSGLHTFFYASYGNGTGYYHIHDINVAGSVIRLFYIDQSGWFSTKIDNIYAESIGTIGTLNTSQMVISLTDCVFDFASKADAGNQYLSTTSNITLGVRYTNCDFNYFGQNYNMVFQGLAAYIGCSFSGAYTNSQQGSIFSSNCQFSN